MNLIPEGDLSNVRLIYQQQDNNRLAQESNPFTSSNTGEMDRDDENENLLISLVFYMNVRGDCNPGIGPTATVMQLKWFCLTTIELNC